MEYPSQPERALQGLATSYMLAAFIQGLMARGFLTLKTAKPMVADIHQAYLSMIEDSDEPAPSRPLPTEAEDIVESHVKALVSAAVELLMPYDYNICSIRNQHTKERMWVLTNMVSDPVTQLATTYGPEELSYLRRLLHAMFTTHNTPRMEVMALTGIEALNLRKPRRGENSNDANGPDESMIDGESDLTQQPSHRAVADKGVSMEQAETFLTTMVEAGWLDHDDKYYTLSARALAELRDWLIDTFNDDDQEDWQPIKFCKACSELITIGQRCAEKDCLVRLHDYCTDLYFRAHCGGARRCAICQTPWSGTHYVGPRAVGRDARMRQRMSTNTAEPSDESDDPEDE